MLRKVVIHFRSGNRQLNAVVQPGGPVKGILLLDEAEREEFSKAHGLELKGGPQVPGVSISDADGEAVSLTALDGPGVCYWVGSTLVCW